MWKRFLLTHFRDDSSMIARLEPWWVIQPGEKHLDDGETTDPPALPWVKSTPVVRSVRKAVDLRTETAWLPCRDVPVRIPAQRPDAQPKFKL